MVLTKVFTFVFIYITEVNIVCKIRECFKFFMFNFNSSFLIVVTVVRLFLILFHEFADRSQPVFLNVVSKAVTVVQSLERYKWKKKKVIKMHFHSVLLHISGSWTIHLIGCIFFNKFTTNAFILICFTCCSFSWKASLFASMLHKHVVEFKYYISAFSSSVTLLIFFKSRGRLLYSSLSCQPQTHYWKIFQLKPAVSLTLYELSSSSALTDGPWAQRWNICAAVASELLTLPTLRLL